MVIQDTSLEESVPTETEVQSVTIGAGVESEKTKESNETNESEETEECNETNVNDETEESNETIESKETEESNEANVSEETEECNETNANEETKQCTETNENETTEESNEMNVSEGTEESNKTNVPVSTIEEILTNQEGKESKHKSIDVFKEVEPVIDAGRLFLNDLQPVDVKKVRANTEVFLNNLARNNTQLLFNRIWQLPIEKVDNVIVCNLPAPATALPREKKIPKPKPPTKWELFAQKKGIANKKRGRMIFDEESKSWKPRFGYKRGKDDTKEWCLEVPVNADPNEDQFEKKNSEKKERVAKNELQRLHNIKRNNKESNYNDNSSNNNLIQKTDKKRVKEEILKDIDLAKLSTASLGKFQEKLPKEKENKKRGKKRTFESVTGSALSEKERALEVWNKINKKPILDVTKGVNKHIVNEQRNTASQKKDNKSGKVKNKRFKKGAQAAGDKKKQKKIFGKGKTLGKKR